MSTRKQQHYNIQHTTYIQQQHFTIQLPIPLHCATMELTSTTRCHRFRSFFHRRRRCRDASLSDQPVIDAQHCDRCRRWRRPDRRRRARRLSHCAAQRCAKRPRQRATRSSSKQTRCTLQTQEARVSSSSFKSKQQFKKTFNKTILHAPIFTSRAGANSIKCSSGECCRTQRHNTAPASDLSSVTRAHRSMMRHDESSLEVVSNIFF